MKAADTPRRVLLADDDPFITALYRDKLTRAGRLVETVANGEDAVRRLQTAPPDLLVLDLNMPRMNGIEVLRFLRERSHTPDLPVIVLSNAGARDFVEEVNRLRPARFLIKWECTPKNVVAEIETVLEETARTGTVVPVAAAVPAEKQPVPREGEKRLEEYRQASGAEERREALLRLYRYTQEDLRKLKESHPLSIPAQLGAALEQWFEVLYARAETAGPTAGTTLETALPLAAACAAQAVDSAAASEWLLILVDDPELGPTLHEACNRPGFLPLRVSREPSAEDILSGNAVRMSVWCARRAGAARKTLHRLRRRGDGNKLHVLFLLPPDEAERLNGELEDPRAAVVAVPGDMPEVLTRLYAWRASVEGPVDLPCHAAHDSVP